MKNTCPRTKKHALSTKGMQGRYIPSAIGWTQMQHSRGPTVAMWLRSAAYRELSKLRIGGVWTSHVGKLATWRSHDGASSTRMVLSVCTAGSRSAILRTPPWGAHMRSRSYSHRASSVSTCTTVAPARPSPPLSETVSCWQWRLDNKASHQRPVLVDSAVQTLQSTLQYSQNFVSTNKQHSRCYAFC